MTDVVLTERRDGLAIVTLNRPDALNALSLELRNALVRTFSELATDSTCEVIVLTGAGRAFTVGLDLKELGGGQASASAAEGDLSDAMLATPQPIIGAVNGYAITGGFEIALLCDFLIATPEARFADTHGRVGVVPGWGLSQRLPRLIGINRAKELSLTGNFLDAEQALDWGLVNRIVPADKLLPTCIDLAGDIMSTERETRDEIKRIMDAGWDATLGDGLTLERDASRAHARREGSARADKVAERRAAIQARGRAQSQD
ncbi:MAG: enoyl-CoA hydratase [Pseudomonadota bacterium]